MACKNNHQYYASTLLLLLTPLVLNAYPLAQARVSVNGIRITGTLCCTTTESCDVGGTPIPGVNLNVSCKDAFGATTVRTRATSLNGRFDIIVPLKTPLLTPVEIVPCQVVTPLPFKNTGCPPLNIATGVLIGILEPLRNIIVYPALGPIANAVVVAWLGGAAA